MILPVYTYNHPVLKQRTLAIDDLSDELNVFIDDMLATMYNANGIGLAANQVGKGLSLTVIDVSDSDEEEESDGPIVLINPVIEAFSDTEEEFEEGCLSLPDFRDVVIRPSEIQVRFLDRHMKEQRIEVGGLLARVMQHEIDHLNGIYFYERLSPIRRTLAQGKLKRIARGDIEPEYEVFRG
ncbi:MAG: peptide deformylase [Candidatus Kapabacteria bacterium]|nr:peptide deformylase [Candidatus Kapabacteria bacterium]